MQNRSQHTVNSHVALAPADTCQIVSDLRFAACGADDTLVACCFQLEQTHATRLPWYCHLSAVPLPGARRLTAVLSWTMGICGGRAEKGAARYTLLAVGVVGEILLGGIIFGWNALSIALKELDFFAEGCRAQAADDGAPASDTCASQESKLAIVWNAGVFAVNFGPALVGVALDAFGPRLIAVSGAALASTGILLMGATSHFVERRCLA